MSVDEKPEGCFGQYKQHLVSEENRDTTGHGAVEQCLACDHKAWLL